MEGQRGLRGRRRRRRAPVFGIWALHLDERGFRKFLRYIENNPVWAGLVRRAWEWKWSSAASHCVGESQAGRLCLDVWKNVFERPDTVAQKWAEYLVGPEVERRLNAARLRKYNRPADCWAADDGERVGPVPVSNYP